MNYRKDIKSISTQLNRIYNSKFHKLFKISRRISLKSQSINHLTEKQLEEKLNLLNREYQQILGNNKYKVWQLFNKFKKNPKKYFKKALIIFKEDGINGLVVETLKRKELYNNLDKINSDYQIWIKKYSPSEKMLIEQKKHNFRYKPLISIIIPTYNSKINWLKKCIDSVIKQTYSYWELSIADDNSSDSKVRNVIERYSQKDKRIKYIFRKENGHISQCSNSALSICSGEFVSLLDHDDELAPNALFEIVKSLNENEKIDLIYSDEDKLELNGKHVEPFFKPDWSPDMFYSMNYFCHLTTIRKKIIDKIGGFRKGYEGSQDYDLFLRVTEITKNIHHIPKILYSWRKAPNSTASEYSVKSYAHQASIKSLQDHLERVELKGEIETGLVGGTFRTKYKIIGKPLISIIIPTKDKVDYLKRCVDSIINKTTYSNYEIIIVDTGSTEEETKRYYQKINKNKKIKLIDWDKPFNYSSVNNFGVKKAKGKYIILLNNDTEVISPDWIENMLEHAQRKEVGAVGCKLLYPDNTLQHAGVILGIRGERNKNKRGVAGHALKRFSDIPLQHPLLNSKDIIRDYSAVTAACLMINKKKFFEVKGLDEKFRIAFNDIDFNLKLRQKGYYNIYTPYTKLYHHESISVGTPENLNRDRDEFKKETVMMIKKWGQILEEDPFYNPNLSKYFENFGIKTI